MTQTALITGASFGIGRALAHQFATHGYDVVLVARNEAALADVARALANGAVNSDESRPTHAAGAAAGAGRSQTPRVHIITADLTQPHSGRALFERLKADNMQVDVLVNNAGFGLQGPFAELPLDRQIDMLQLNVVALTELTRLFLPELLARRTGGVLNVASTAAFQPGPLMAVYYATKAYVLSLTEAIAEEVAGNGVKVSCLCPGPTVTEFATRAGMTGTNLFKTGGMSAEDVAREGFDAWNRGQVLCIAGGTNRRATMLVRLMPRSVVRRIVKRLNSNAS